MVRSLLTALALFSASAAGAQTLREPSDVELHAGYCLGLAKTQVAQLENAFKLSPTFNPPAPQSVLAGMKNDLSAAEDRKSRMTAYLAPKLQYVDLAGIVAAGDRGEVDAKTYWSLTLTYGATVPADLSTRVAACEKSDWLPF